MKRTAVLYFVVAFFLCMANTHQVNGQKVLSGDLKFLKGQESINVVFDFAGLKIEKETEAEFLKREADAKNAKEAGSGDKFLLDWEKDKIERFSGAFKKVMNEALQKNVEDPNAKYTLVVYNINLVNKGWGNKISGGHPAQLEVDFKFVETANQSNTLCELREEQAKYLAMTGTISQKIQGCLEYAGRMMAKSMSKNL